MVSICVLQQEVGVEDLGIGKHAKHLVGRVPLVYQFMTCKTVHSGHVTPNKGKYEPTTESVSMLALKQKSKVGSCKEVPTAHNAETPEPCKTVIDKEHIERSQEALVFGEHLLTCLAQIGLSAGSCKGPDLPTRWHIKDVRQPYRNQHVARHLVHDV